MGWWWEVESGGGGGRVSEAGSVAPRWLVLFAGREAGLRGTHRLRRHIPGALLFAHPCANNGRATQPPTRLARARRWSHAEFEAQQRNRGAAQPVGGGCRRVVLSDGSPGMARASCRRPKVRLGGERSLLARCHCFSCCRAQSSSAQPSFIGRNRPRPVLYCAVPCSAVRVMPCCSVPCCSVPCCSVPCLALPCLALPCLALQFSTRKRNRHAPTNLQVHISNPLPRTWDGPLFSPPPQWREAR